MEINERVGKKCIPSAETPWTNERIHMGSSLYYAEGVFKVSALPYGHLLHNWVTAYTLSVDASKARCV